MTRPRSSRVAALFALTVASVAIGAPSATAAAVHTSDFARFFSGRTEGLGRLKIIMRGPVTVRVQGVGHTEPDGTLVLAQVVNEGDKPARTRTWRLREVSPGRFVGTLSDARGPVMAERLDSDGKTGERLHLAFAGLDGNGYQQWLTFAADGRSAHNTLEVHKYGMTVATLEETIRKID